jgi:hypothetical protein
MSRCWGARSSGSAAPGAVSVRASAGECTGLDDQVLLADRAAVEPALEDLADPRRAARLGRQLVPEVCEVMPLGIVRQWRWSESSASPTTRAPRTWCPSAM